MKTMTTTTTTPTSSRTTTTTIRTLTFPPAITQSSGVTHSREGKQPERERECHFIQQFMTDN
jgi:hypothetical protein